MLVTLKELLDQAKVEHKAVGAFNGTTLEAIRGIIQAAEELNAPVLRSLSTRRKLRKNMVKQQIQGYLFNKSTKYGERRCA